MKKIDITYGDLKVNDIIIFHGALVKINAIRNYNHYKTGEPVVNFDIAPYNEEAIEILGSFYSRGTYGGLSILPITKVIL